MANPLVEAMKIGEEKKEQEIMLAEDAYNEQWRDQIDYGPTDPEPGEAVYGTEEGGQTFFDFVKSLQISPELIAGFLDDLKIDPTAHKGAQKKTKIYNKATQGSGSEKDWLKKTGPQLPLASIPESYRREGIGNPFDIKMQEYNRNLPSDERIRILNEAIKMRA
jgi:hypothetical protein